MAKKKLKILHTADWHIGKQLHKYSLEEDHEIFFDWLYEEIISRQIDLLLVSGDMFDSAFPSNRSLSLYYGFLTRFLNNDCRIIITGGNHDSPGVLNAPRDILSHLKINVVGDVTGFPDSCYFSFPEWELSVAAIPFLRDADLRKSVSGAGFGDRVEMIREGISRHYLELIKFHQQNHPQFNLIGMGHLFVAGAEVSESEREIHVVGDLAAYNSSQFPPGFDYMALGHIHKPQKISELIRYSGSPIPLSFSERTDQKYVIELVFENGLLTETQAVPVPAVRELRSFIGSLEQIRNQLMTYQPETRLEPLVEIEVIEEDFDPEKSLRFESLIQEFHGAGFAIVKPRLTFLNRMKQAAELFVTGTEIEDLSPRQVFTKLLENELLDEDVRQLLTQAFEELLGSMVTLD